MSEKRLSRHLKIDDKRFYVGTGLMAYILNMTDRNLRNLANKGCPKEGTGWWDPQAVLIWTNDTEDSKSLAAREKKALVEYREHKAEKERINLEALKGNYTQNEIIEEERVKRIHELKRGLHAMIQAALLKIPDEEYRDLVEGVLADEIEELLEQYSRQGFYTPSRY